MARRRGKGEGSILKRKDGTWQGAVTVGYDENGKQKRKTVYGKTQKEVVEKIHAIKQQLMSGTFSENNLTVKMYLERWLTEKARQVKPRTVELYREQAERYVYPRIGSVKLKKLTPLQVQTMMSEIADAVGVSTANKCRLLLFSSLKQAVRWQLLARNPVEAVDKLKEQPKKMSLWAPAEAVRFLETIQNDRLYAAFYVLMSTGLRRGELLGLEWGDLTGNVLHIRRSLTILDSKPAFSTPKTEKGTRRVAVSPDVLDVLEQHRAHQEAEKRFMGQAWVDSDLIFTQEAGIPINPGTFNRLWKRLKKEANVSDVRLHDLRHLHVSLLVRQGFDPRTIADRVGHTDPSFTLNHYSHAFEEQRQAAAVSLADLLSPPTRTDLN